MRVIVLTALFVAGCNAFVARISSMVPTSRQTFPSPGSVARRTASGRGLRMYDDVDPRAAFELSQSGYPYIDVRTTDEFSNGHPKGAVNIPAFLASPAGMQPNADFVAQVTEKFPEKSSKLVIGCQMGARSAKIDCCPAFLFGRREYTVEPNIDRAIDCKTDWRAHERKLYLLYNKAAQWLEDAGYEVLFNVEGGYGAWARDESLPVER